MTTNLSIENLKSALLELAQADRAFFVALITDLIKENDAKTGTSLKNKKPKQIGNMQPTHKIIPPYRTNPEALRAKYAMDNKVLLQLQDLFSDAPSAEAFLQASNAQ